MTDRVIQHPGRYQLVPVSGTTDQYDLVAVPGTVTAEGTPLNKATLLTDAVAALLGVSSASVPNDIFKLLAARYGTCSTAAGTVAKVGTLSNFVLSTGAVVGIKFTNANTATNPTLNVNSTGAKAIYCGGAASVSGQITAGMMALFQYDGTYWQLLNPAIPADGSLAFAKLASAAIASQAQAEAGTASDVLMTPQRAAQAIAKLGVHVVQGSYTGTGTFGSSNPTSIALSFVPKAVFISSGSWGAYPMYGALILLYGRTSGTTISYNSLNSNKTISWSLSGNTVSWYNTESANYQLNAGTMYYFAIG